MIRFDRRERNSIPNLSRMFATVSILIALLMLPLAAGALAQDSLQKDIDALKRSSKARAAIVKEVRKSVVHISVEKKVTSAESDAPNPFDDPFFRRFFQPRMPNQPREFKQRGLGSGVIVSKDGYILTNNHVVADSDKIIVKLTDGSELEAKLVGTDPATDIAVVQVKGNNLPVARLGNSDELEVGESVIAIGNPFGLEQTVTSGIVSAKGRSGVGVSDYEDFIQTDASINPGNSGGPLINLDGQVIGINTAIFSRSGGNMGIGFAIPINMTQAVMTALIDSGKVTRGFLGVVIQDVTQELADALGIKPGSGVLISSVGPESPAAKAGIKQGDLIVSFNEKEVKTSNQLRNTVASLAPGANVPVALIREGKTMKVNVHVGEQPENMRAAFQQEGGGTAPQGALGMTVEPLNPAAAQQFGYVGLSGLLVTAVEPDSLAAQAGMRDGALILEANRKPVRMAADLERAIQETKSGKSLLLLVRLGEVSRFLVIKVP